MATVTHATLDAFASDVATVLYASVYTTENGCGGSTLIRQKIVAVVVYTMQFIDPNLITFIACLTQLVICTKQQQLCATHILRQAVMNYLISDTKKHVCPSLSISLHTHTPYTDSPPLS